MNIANYTYGCNTCMKIAIVVLVIDLFICPNCTSHWAECLFLCVNVASAYGPSISLVGFGPARHLKIDDMDLNFREVLQEIQAKQNNNKIEVTRMQYTAWTEDKDEGRAKDSAFLVLLIEQARARPPHATWSLGSINSSNHLLLSSTLSVPQSFLGTSKGQEVKREDRKQRTELILIKFATNDNSKHSYICGSNPLSVLYIQLI